MEENKGKQEEWEKEGWKKEGREGRNKEWAGMGKGNKLTGGGGGGGRGRVMFKGFRRRKKGKLSISNFHFEEAQRLIQREV